MAKMGGINLAQKKRHHASGFKIAPNETEEIEEKKIDMCVDVQIFAL